MRGYKSSFAKFGTVRAESIKMSLSVPRSRKFCEALPGVYFGHMESPRSTLLPKTPRVVPFSAAVDRDTPIHQSSLMAEGRLQKLEHEKLDQDNVRCALLLMSCVSLALRVCAGTSTKAPVFAAQGAPLQKAPVLASLPRSVRTAISTSSGLF